MNGNEQVIIQGGATTVVLALFYVSVRWMMQRIEKLMENQHILTQEFITTVQNHISHSTEVQTELKEAIRELSQEIRNGRGNTRRL